MAFKWKITEITTTPNGAGTPPDLAEAQSVMASAMLYDTLAPNTVITATSWTASGIRPETTAAALQTQMMAFFRNHFNNYLKCKQLEQQGQGLINVQQDL